MSDEVTRGSTVLLNGDVAWPAPLRPPPPHAAATPKKGKVVAVVTEETIRKETLRTALGTAGATTALVALNMLSSDPAFLAMATTFALSGCAGYQVRSSL